MNEHLTTLSDYVERSTHWREGGATRHDALKLALPALKASIEASALEVEQAIGYVDRVRTAPTQSVSYETMQRAAFNRPTGWRRKYTLADARSDAKTATESLRRAWQHLDPISP